MRWSFGSGHGLVIPIDSAHGPYPLAIKWLAIAQDIGVPWCPADDVQEAEITDAAHGGTCDRAPSWRLGRHVIETRCRGIAVSALHQHRPFPGSRWLERATLCGG